MDLTLQIFIYNRNNIAYILRGQQELGAHTDVVEFQPNKVSVFRWTHHGARPMGFRVIIQCTACQHLKTLKPLTDENDNTRLLLKCSNCQKSTAYKLLEGWKWAISSPAKGDERGAWIVRVDFYEEDEAMDVE
jgi:hypothetical protein